MEAMHLTEENAFCAWVTAYHNQNFTEVTGEFVLPDYHANIKRVLCVRPHVHLDGHYFEGGRLLYDGVVHYSVLYIAEDDSVGHFSLSFDFSDGVAMEEPQGEQVLHLTPTVSQNGYRVLGPRKMHLKTKVGTQILLRQKECVAPKVVGAHTQREESGLQYALSSVDTMAFFATTAKDLTLSHTMEIGANLPAVAELCYTEAHLRFEDCSVTQSETECRGSLFLQCLYHGIDGNYISVQESVPVSCVVEESAFPNCACRAVASIRSKKVETAENPYGEQRLIEVVLEYDLSLEAAENQSVQTVQDAYSVDYPCTVAQTTLKTPTLQGVYHANLTLHEGKSREELGAESAQSVLLVYADPQIQKSEYDSERGRLILEGEARCGALFSAGSDASCTDVSFSMPIRFELSGIQVKGLPEYRYDCHVVRCGGRLDSAQFYPNIELGLDIMVSSVQDQTLVETVHLDPSAPYEKTAHFTLCYLQKGETLWEIAKRYRTTEQALLQKNHLQAEQPLPKVLLV